MVIKIRLINYQYEQVLQILKSGLEYRAKPNMRMKKEYDALIDMLELNCDCPVFAVVEGKKQNSSGRVSSSVRLVLEVPEEHIKLTEYEVWADFMYVMKFSQSNDYRKLISSYHEISQKHYKELINSIKEQKELNKYRYPQAIIEYIDSKWLVSYRKIKANEKKLNVYEKITNFFRR